MSSDRIIAPLAQDENIVKLGKEVIKKLEQIAQNSSQVK